MNNKGKLSFKLAGLLLLARVAELAGPCDWWSLLVRSPSIRYFIVNSVL